MYWKLALWVLLALVDIQDGILANPADVTHVPDNTTVVEPVPVTELMRTSPVEVDPAPEAKSWLRDE